MNNKDIHVDRGQISQRFGKMHQYLSLYFVNMLTMLLVSGTIQIARYGFKQLKPDLCCTGENAWMIKKVIIFLTKGKRQFLWNLA